MNILEEKYEIRRAHSAEIDEIRAFIDAHWRHDHILARDRAFFEYEMVVDGQVNFVIARERAGGAIHAIHGFILTCKDCERPDIWGVMWKALPGAPALLGHETTRKIMEITNARAMYSVGDNPKTSVPILKILRKYKDVSRMKHYYCLAAQDEYRLAVVRHYEPLPEADPKSAVQVKLLCDYGDLERRLDLSVLKQSCPHKDLWYLRHRYFEHPRYDYEIYGLSADRGGSVAALLIARKQEYQGARALRLVDYLGEQSCFGGLTPFLREKLREFEYLDFYCHGFEERYLTQAGMVELTADDSNIIPNYFAPYEARNIDIWVGAPETGATFFKADGAQDRPN